MSVPMLGEPLPIELVNTLHADRRQIVDGLTTPDDLAAWLRSHVSEFRTDVAAAGGERLGEFHELREALRQLFQATLAPTQPPATAVATLNRMSATAPALTQLVWPNTGEPRIAVTREGSDPAAAALAKVAQAGIELLGGPNRERLRACHAPGCVLYFLKDHPRRAWCSAGCGNRARAARHYQRHRSRMG